MQEKRRKKKPTNRKPLNGRQKQEREKEERGGGKRKKKKKSGAASGVKVFYMREREARGRNSCVSANQKMICEAAAIEYPWKAPKRETN